MTKRWRLKLFAAGLAAVLSLQACAANTQQKLYSNAVFDDKLTATYNIEDLEGYIRERHASLFRYQEKLSDVLFYDELNEKFPVQMLHYEEHKSTLAYTVYQVEQGGYYYVFWSHIYPVESKDDIPQFPDWENTQYMCIYHSAYIKSPKSLRDFRTLKPGVHTAADVLSLDPYAELVILSRGRFTYSWIDEDTVLEIEYSPDEEYVDNMELEHLVIKKISTVARIDSASCFGKICKEDIPRQGQRDGSVVPSGKD